MIKIAEDRRHVLPPMATVTVEKVFAPGEWPLPSGEMMDKWVIELLVGFDA